MILLISENTWDLLQFIGGICLIALMIALIVYIVLFAYVVLKDFKD